MGKTLEPRIDKFLQDCAKDAPRMQAVKLRMARSHGTPNPITLQKEFKLKNHQVSRGGG